MLCGGHPTLPDVSDGRVKVTAVKVKEVGAATIGVGVIPFHGKDLYDSNTCTVLLHLILEESVAVVEAPAPSAKSVSADKTSEIKQTIVPHKDSP